MSPPPSPSPPPCIDDLLFFNPHLESLTFEEAELTFYVDALHAVKLPGGVIIHHHRLGDDPAKDSLYQSDAGYLHTIFKHYLESLPKQPTDEADSQRGPPRNRTAFIAQFSSAQGASKKNPPTYGVSYEFDVSESATGRSQSVVLIGYRQLTAESFLCSALGALGKPVTDETSRLCLLVEAHSARADDQPNVIETANCIGPYRLCPRMMSLREIFPLRSSRILTVATNSWLVVFLKYCSKAYILLSGEFLIFGPSMRDVPLLYKRTVDMDAAQVESDELYFRQTILEQHNDGCTGGAQYSPGMCCSQAMVHNELEENTFAVIGAGNGPLDMAYLQMLCSTVGSGDTTAK